MCLTSVFKLSETPHLEQTLNSLKFFIHKFCNFEDTKDFCACQTHCLQEQKSHNNGNISQI